MTITAPPSDGPEIPDIEEADLILVLPEYMKRKEHFKGNPNLKDIPRSELITHGNAMGLKEVYGLPWDVRVIMAKMTEMAQPNRAFYKYVEFAGGSETEWGNTNDHFWILPPDEMK